MKSALVAFLLVSGASLSAQSRTLVPNDARPDVRLIEPGTPGVHVVYDVEQRRIRSIEPLGPDRIELGGPCYDNSGGPQIAFTVSNPGEELVDWGTKLCRQSGLIKSFTVMYGSSAVPVANGGPGGAMSLGLFEGTRGFGDLGSEIFRHTITGLPTGFALLTVDFGIHPLPLPDGHIGWSILQIDGHTGPVLVTAPSTLLGTIDALDLYSPGPATTDAYVGTFNFGGCQNTPWLCASLFIQLDEIPQSQVANSAIVNGTGVNPVLLRETLPARLGQLWVGSIDMSGQPIASTTLLVAASATIAPVQHPLGELLLDPSTVLASPFPGVGGYVFPIPADASLAGVRLFVQGVVLPSGFPSVPFLTNALRVRLGY